MAPVVVAVAVKAEVLHPLAKKAVSRGPCLVAHLGQAVNHQNHITLPGLNDHQMVHEVNQTLQRDLIDQAQLRAISQAHRVPSLKLQDGNRDLEVAQPVAGQGRVVQSLGHRLQDLDLIALNPDHKVQSLGPKVLNHKQPKAVPAPNQLLVVQENQDQGVSHSSQRAQFKGRMFKTADPTHLI